jgi:PleD family two-component response regulator
MDAACEDVLERAVAAMYQAKRNGRDRVSVLPPSETAAAAAIPVP